MFLYFFPLKKAIDVSVSSLLHLCHTLPAKKDLKKTVEFDIGFAIARIWSTASNSMNSLNTANLTEIYTVCKLFSIYVCAMCKKSVDIHICFDVVEFLYWGLWQYGLSSFQAGGRDIHIECSKQFK